MKKLLVLLLFISTLSYSQNTFYTKGLEKFNSPADDDEFYIESTNYEHFAKVSIRLNFSYVEILDDKTSLDYIVTETELLDDNDYNKGYRLLCESSSGQKVQLVVNLERRCIYLYIHKEDDSIDAYVLFIKTID